MKKIAFGPLAAFALVAFGARTTESAATGVHFTDVTAAAGIRFTHNSGRTGKKWLPETMGSGCVFFDADGDGWQDILSCQREGLDAAGTPQSLARSIATTATERSPTSRAGSGLDIEMYGMGVAAGRLRQRRPRRCLHHRARRRSPVSQRGQRQVPRRDEGGRDRQRRFRGQRGLARLRPGRQADLFVANYVQWTAEGRSVVLARRADEIVLHAGVVQRNFVEAVSTISATASSRM